MALKPLKPCNKVGCRELTRQSYCEQHMKEYEQDRLERDKQRGTATQRGYNSRWRKARTMHLARQPLCVACGKPATDVDHIKPHKGDSELFWDKTNWQSLCKSCHSIKTATQDGGFGCNNRRG